MNSSAKSSCDIRNQWRPAGHYAGLVSGPTLGRFQCGSYCDTRNEGNLGVLNKNMFDQVQAIWSFVTTLEPSAIAGCDHQAPATCGVEVCFCLRRNQAYGCSLHQWFGAGICRDETPNASDKRCKCQQITSKPGSQVCIVCSWI